MAGFSWHYFKGTPLLCDSLSPLELGIPSEDTHPSCGIPGCLVRVTFPLSCSGHMSIILVPWEPHPCLWVLHQLLHSPLHSLNPAKTRSYHECKCASLWRLPRRSIQQDRIPNTLQCGRRYRASDSPCLQRHLETNCSLFPLKTKQGKMGLNCSKGDLGQIEENPAGVTGTGLWELMEFLSLGIFGPRLQCQRQPIPTACCRWREKMVG